MKKIWSLLLTTTLGLLSLSAVQAQEAEENRKTTLPNVSCLGLENPQTEGQMDEFKDCIKRFNEERKSIIKQEFIQKKIDASRLVVEKHNPDEKRQTVKLSLNLNELKFRDSGKLSERIKIRLLGPGNPLPSATE